MERLDEKYYENENKEEIKIAEFVGGEVKYVKVGEPIGIAPLPKPIATVKFDVRSPGTYKVAVRQDGSWIAEKEERINEI